MPGENLASLFVRLGADTKAWSQGFSIARRDLAWFEKQALASSARLEAIGTRWVATGRKMSAGITLPLALAGAAAAKFGSDAQESLDKARVVFGTAAGAVESFASSSARSLGISRQATLEAAATFGAFFRGIDVATPAAATMSTQLVKLASDMASFSNADPSDMLERLLSGLAGQEESLRKFAVRLSAARVEEKAFELGLASSKKELDDKAKILARYAIIMEDTVLQQGNFADTAHNTANQLRTAKAEASDTAAAFGQNLQPAATAVAVAVGNVAKAFGNLSPANQQIVILGGAAAAVAGPVMTLTGHLTKFVGSANATRVALEGGLVTYETFGKAVGGVAKGVAGMILKWVALPAAVGGASYAITRFIADVTGLDSALRDHATKPADEVAEALAKDEERFRATAEQVSKLKEQLNLTGEAWAFNATRSKESAERLVVLRDALVAVTRQKVLAAAAERTHLSALEWATQVIERNRKVTEAATLVQAAFVKSLKEHYDVVTEGETKGAMQRLVQDFATLAKEGVSAQQLLETFAPKVGELQEKAKGYTDLDVPDDFRRLAEALSTDTGGGVWSVRMLGEELGEKLPEAAAEAREGIENAFSGVGATIGDGIADGLLKGGEDGTAKLKETIDRWVQGYVNQPLRIPIQFYTSNDPASQEALARALAALEAAGKTGGNVY